MGYHSYAESEFKLVPEYNDVKEHVLKILEIINEEGHSGGSMGVFSGMFRNWAKNPVELKGNDLFEPIWNIVKEIPYGKVPRTLEVVGKLMTFTPLSFLTGEDDEWNQLDHDSGTKYQNKRMGNVFKNNKNEAYWIDGRVFYEPSSSLNNFVGFTSRESRVTITFPFDPETKPECVYYSDTDRKNHIETTYGYWENAKTYIKGMQDNYFSGLDPYCDLFKQVAEAFFLDTVEEKDECIRLFRNVMSEYKEAIKKLPVAEVIDDLKTTMGYWIWQESGRETYSKLFKTYPIGYKIMRNVQRMIWATGLLDNQFTMFEAISDDTAYEFVKVYAPTKHYQEWEHNGKFHLSFLNRYGQHSCIRGDSRQEHTCYYSANYGGFLSNTIDPYKHLYNYCKENGLEYKGPKK